MVSSRVKAAVAIAAALRAVPPLPEVVAPPVRLPGDPESNSTTAPQINPKTGKPFRGIPQRAARRGDPVRAHYASGSQPFGVAKMLEHRRQQAQREAELMKGLKRRSAAAKQES